MMGSDLISRRIELEDSLEAFYGLLEREDWSDGLPAVPPTPERVEAMIAASGRSSDEIVTILPPRRGVATVGKVAINAVMAGCRPEYFPVVLAAVEATGDPSFNLNALNTTTNTATTMLIINGPGRDTLGINYKESCFGIGGRANATIGRAVRLVQLNIAGAVPGVGSKSVFGQPGRYTMCAGEWEEKSPWEPLHVQRGFGHEENCVTVFGSTDSMNIVDIWSRDAEGYLTTIAHSIDHVGGSWMVARNTEVVIILCPEWAECIARDGFSIADVKQFLWEKSKIPLDRFAKGHHDPLRERGRVGPADLVAITEVADNFSVLVAGGLAGHHSFACHGFGSERSVTRAFTLPVSITGSA